MLTGHNSTLCFGQGAGLMGLGISWNSLRSGHADALISGSVDTLPASNFDCKSVDNTANGEGACMFMLETLSHATSRNARILGEICSFAYSTETTRGAPSRASSGLLEKTISEALAQAKIAPANIHAVCFCVNEPQLKQAIDSVLGYFHYKTYDVCETFGIAPATHSSYNLVYALLDSSFETLGSKKYILSVFSSSYGAHCAAIFATGK
jgi:hypothetical protein